MTLKLVFFVMKQTQNHNYRHSQLFILTKYPFQKPYDLGLPQEAFLVHEYCLSLFFKYLEMMNFCFYELKSARLYVNTSVKTWLWCFQSLSLEKLYFLRIFENHYWSMIALVFLVYFQLKAYFGASFTLQLFSNTSHNKLDSFCQQLTI